MKTYDQYLAKIKSKETVSFPNYASKDKIEYGIEVLGLMLQDFLKELSVINLKKK